MPFMMTSPPFMPGLQAPIHVMVMVVSGALLPSTVITMVTLELKSPLTCTWVVRVPPVGSLQVVVLFQDPSRPCETELDWQLVRRNCELKIDTFASDSGVTQDCEV